MKRVEVMAFKREHLLKMVQVFSFTLLLALLSQIRIPLPFTPVPLTLQTLGILFIGYYLGKTYGVLSVLLYLFLGTLGLPFFSGIKGGLLVLSGPTGGYLLGFLAGVYLVGTFKERGYLEKPQVAFGTALLSHFLIYLFGVSWFLAGNYTLGLSQTFKEVFTLTVLPFLPFDVVKALLFAGFVATEKRVKRSI